MSEKKPVLILAGDSRINGFDKFNYEGFRTRFIIKRGALVEDLIDDTLEKVRDYKDENRDVIVKIAVGINEFTEFVKTDQGRFIKYKGTLCKSVIRKVRSFKEKIKSIRPSTVVGLVTVPSLSFRANRDFRIKENSPVGKAKSKNSKPSGQIPTIISNEELERDQRKLDSELLGLNADIKLENSRKQSGLLKGCFTVSWHNSISKWSIRKRRSGSRKVIRNSFKELYDGLHAKHTLKRKWHAQLLKTANSELKLIKDYNLKTTKVTVNV